jgi:hypothetical protein
VINRYHPLDPEHLEEWRRVYDVSLAAFQQGAIAEFKAYEILRSLGFRSDALKIEYLIWRNSREEYRNRPARSVYLEEEE